MPTATIPGIEPSKMTEQQVETLIDAQRRYGVALSADLSNELQRALVKWAADLNAKGEPIPMVSTYFCLAVAAASFVHMAAMQLRGNGFDEDALGQWFSTVGHMAESILAAYKFEDSTVNLGEASPEVATKAEEAIAEDRAHCDKLRDQQREVLKAITEGIATGKLVGSIGHA
jgi:hypothetical protein